jgi:Protein of unknown function (DUF3363)
LRIERSALGLEDQVVHKGPVWLDAVHRDGLAPYGLGAELPGCLAKRDAVLRANGIDPAGPEKHHALRELERRVVAARIVAETRQEFLERVPDGFRGVVRVHERHKGRDAAYVEITDGMRFILLPTQRELENQRGRTVSVSYDREGRLRTSPHDRSRGRS